MRRFPAVLRPLALALVVLGASMWPGGGVAQGRSFTLSLPDEIAATGVPRFLLPRFALKHGIRANLVPAGEPADAAVVAEPVPGSVPAFEIDGRPYFLLLKSANPHAARFADWLVSDIGRRTLAGYGGKDVALAPPTAAAKVKKVKPITGDALAGLAISRERCGRCHVVDAENRMRGIGSTPAFTTLRALPDWRERFETFYVRNPHPSYTQIPGVTDPFPPDRPPPIFPIEITLDELDDVLAYVAALEPADLGAPVRSQ